MNVNLKTEARDKAEELIANNCWPCYFFATDTTGEKDFEEFFTEKEDLDMNRFETVGVIKNQPIFDEAKLDEFMSGIDFLREKQVHGLKKILLNYILEFCLNFHIMIQVNT